MKDVEKLVKQIANCVHDGLCNDCPYKKYAACRHFMLADALALIKEQQTVVRCGECKHKYYELSDGRIVCTHIDKEGNDEHGADWFCADGERKEE